MTISILPERVMLDVKVWVAKVKRDLFLKFLIDATMQDGG